MLTRLSPIRPQYNLVLFQSDLVQTQEGIEPQNLYPGDRLPIEHRDQDQVDNRHLDLPPNVLVDPTHQANVIQKDGKTFLKIDLGTSHLSILRIIMGHNMEWGFMDYYHLSRMFLAMHLPFLRSNNLSLSILKRLW